MYSHSVLKTLGAAALFALTTAFSGAAQAGQDVQKAPTVTAEQAKCLSANVPLFNMMTLMTVKDQPETVNKDGFSLSGGSDGLFYGAPVKVKGESGDVLVSIGVSMRSKEAAKNASKGLREVCKKHPDFRLSRIIENSLRDILDPIKSLIEIEAEKRAKKKADREAAVQAVFKSGQKCTNVFRPGLEHKCKP